MAAIWRQRVSKCVCAARICVLILDYYICILKAEACFIMTCFMRAMSRVSGSSLSCDFKKRFAWFFVQKSPVSTEWDLVVISALCLAVPSTPRQGLISVKALEWAVCSSGGVWRCLVRDGPIIVPRFLYD